MNEDELTTFLTPLAQGTSWGARCVRQMLQADNLSDVAAGLVARNGAKPVTLGKDGWDAWGIDIATCYTHCSRTNFPMVFDFPIFTSGVTNYLLPWLGLTAQLPYESGTVSGDFQSFCLAVGSPMLSTFSLMSTTLNAHSTSKMFEARFGNRTRSEMKEAVKYAEYFLCGSQQSPVRIKEDEFENLFREEPERLRDRWEIVKERLESTRRQYSFSLVAQMSFAVIAWVLTIVGSYATALGQHSEALLLSSGTLWTWLVPVVLGWMAAGVQSRQDTVRDAIRGEVKRGEGTPMKALEAVGLPFLNRPHEDKFLALLGDIQGDEKLQGPAFNYARILTYPKLRDRVVRAFEEKLDAFDEKQHRKQLAIADAVVPQPGTPNDLLEVLIHRQDSGRNSVFVSSSTSGISHTSAGSSHQTTSAPDATAPRTRRPDGNNPYMPWNEITSTPDWTKNFLLSNAVALILQWGVTGAAIVISYLTEVRGLGCRSGSYLLYGILATSAHALLLSSVFLSHGAMQLFQEKAPAAERTALHTALCNLAVATRYLGKCIAATNALWIVLSSLFELIGFYESCWCTGTVLALGQRAWVVLFVSGDAMRDEAEPSWVGGLAMSLLTMTLTYLVTKAYSWGRRN